MIILSQKLNYTWSKSHAQLVGKNMKSDIEYREKSNKLQLLISSVIRDMRCSFDKTNE